jgi:Alpha amylase, catalytic domain
VNQTEPETAHTLGGDDSPSTAHHGAWCRLSGGKHADPSGADLVDFDSYDITSRCAVDPVFGTLAGFDGLLAAAHARRLRVLAGLGPDHTSTGTRGSFEPVSRRRDWYVRVDPVHEDRSSGTLRGSWAVVKSGPGSGRLERCLLRTISSQAGEGSPETTGGGRR